MKNLAHAALAVIPAATAATVFAAGDAAVRQGGADDLRQQRPARDARVPAQPRGQVQRRVPRPPIVNDDTLRAAA